jgi:hypothetical protein
MPLEHPLGLRARIAIVVALAGLTGVLAAAPGPLGSPIRRLANYRPDTRNPIFNVLLNGPALRRAGAIIPDSCSETFYVHTRPEPQLGHDLIGAGLLFFLPAVPVPEPREARWILSYEAPRRLPPGVRALRTYVLAPKILLVRVEPA